VALIIAPLCARLDSRGKAILEKRPFNEMEVEIEVDSPLIKRVS
jgi:hypothetical protein